MYPYMDLCCSLRIKERFYSAPQHSKSSTSIDDEHAIQGLQCGQQFTWHQDSCHPQYKDKIHRQTNQKETTSG